MDILDWIQDWFKDNCDGNLEHGDAIQINTLDKPGWEVEIDISTTSIASMNLDWILNENDKDDW